MDYTTTHLSDYVCGLSYKDLSPETVHQAKRTLIDTIGCAVGALEGEPPAIARRVASQVNGNPPARVLGERQQTSMDLAAFVNTILVRYLDYNDTYETLGTGHPSDMIPGVLATADGHRANGQMVITAITAAYEVYCRFIDAVLFKGWDQGMFVAIGVACGAGMVLGLDQAALGNAISMAISTGLPLGVTRTGELSMWKGCATAAAARTGVFAAMLAAEGMTGPGQPFEGREGLWQNLGIETPKWPCFGGKGGSFQINRASFKAYPAVLYTQGPVSLVLELREKVAVSDIESVRVLTFEEAIRRTATEAEKWDPQTRETADHSLPYLVAAAFQDGKVTPATFERARIQDPNLRPLIRKLTVVEEPEFTRRYPAESCTRIEVTAKGGKRIVAETNYPKGHYRNPLTDGEVEEKFRDLAERRLGVKGCDRLLAEIWSLETAATLDGLFESLTVSDATS